MVAFRLEPARLAELEAWARARGVSRTDAIRGAIERMVKGKGRK